MDNFMENEKKFECDQCLESFNRNFSLTLHKTVIHSSTKTLKCNESGKIYNLEDEFHNTKSEFHNIQENIEKKSLKDVQIKRFYCQQCDNTFKTKQGLEKHVSTKHNKERNYNCEQCMKSFGQKCSLLRHIAIIHNRTRKHKFHICQKTFSIKSNMKIHINLRHKGEKLSINAQGMYKCENFKGTECPQCKKTFKTISYLSSHIDNVHQEKKISSVTNVENHSLKTITSSTTHKFFTRVSKTSGVIDAQAILETKIN